MNAQERFRRAEALFRSAGAMPEELREAFLAEQCAGEPTLLESVRAWLAADRRGDGILDRPALVAVSEALGSASDDGDELPQRLGGYRVIRKIGEGGMGSVFEAEQENPRRRVALKLLRAGAGSRSLIRRFEQEAQILGRLQHPGIAQILEAGTAVHAGAARPYLAMELVQGRSLLEHAGEFRLSRRERLALFALVCDAVHYAHQSGVIHRDLKPQNILVVAENTASRIRPAESADRTSAAAPQRAAPKILDFGVARLVDADIQAVTQQTTQGELIGTVPYMSPEQAAGDPAQLDWRSDVYSLGVILYELLAGRLPHEVRHLAVIEAVRVIREDDPTPAGSLDRSLRGDLETILARALEKDKLRRYQSAADLALDIRRHLDEQPIAARPASALYRLRKFARRNKAIVAGVTIAFAAMALGAAFATRMAIVAERARVDERRLRGVAERQSYRACMLAASSALRRNETAEAERHLDAAPAALRGWEWEHLHSRLDDSLVQRQTFSPWWFAISPDGETLAACNSGGRIVAWNVADWSECASFSLRGGVTARRIIQLAYSPDGESIRADTRVASVTLDADTLAPGVRTERPVMARSRDGVLSARFDDDESPPVIYVEEYATGRELFPVAADATADAMVQFSRDGRYLAAALTRGQTVLVQRCPDGALLFTRSDLNSVVELCFSGDGSRLAVGTGFGDAAILDVADGRTLASLRGHNGPLGGVDFSPDGTRVATASNDGTVRLWDAATGAPRSTMHAKQPTIYSAAFMPDGATVVTAGPGSGLRWWDALAAEDPFVLSAPGYVYGVRFAPDGRTLAAACLTGARPLRTWSASDGREQLAALDGNLTALCFSRDGEKLAVCQRGDTRIVAAADGSVSAKCSTDSWRTEWAAFDPSGERLLTLEFAGRLSAYDASSGREIRSRTFRGKAEGHGCRAALSPDGMLLAVAAGSVIHLLDAESWADVATLTGHSGNIYALAFGPDGARLVSGGVDRALRVWDVRRRAPLAALTGHSDEIFAALFSPDGKRILSGGRDTVIRVWDAETFDEITQLHGHTSYVYCLAFSPDGSTLASGGGDNTVRVWGTRPYRQWRGR